MNISKTLSPNQSELDDLNRNFQDYVASIYPQLPDESEDRRFLFSALEELEFVGGICGSVYWDALEIDTLWVAENYRGRGLGIRLLTEAENYARENGAVISFLKTVDAKEFYQNHGYQVYGQLEDRPIGTILYHMKKRLDGR